MDYCTRCLYPENAKPTIIFDDDGVCSGCRYHESRLKIDWTERRQMLEHILDEHKQRAKESGNPYDCIIPVSGGTFQCLAKCLIPLGPLLTSVSLLTALNTCFTLGHSFGHPAPPKTSS